MERLAETLLGDQHPNKLELHRPYRAVRFLRTGQLEGSHHLLLGRAKLIVLEEHFGQHQPGVDDDIVDSGGLSVVQRRAC